jgi:hypothetical protein
LGTLIPAFSVQKSCERLFLANIDPDLLLFLTEVTHIDDWNIRNRAYFYDVQRAL